MDAMELEDILKNAVAAERSEQMKHSDQLTLGELILKLESVDDLSGEVVFSDPEYRPTGAGSWRGSYQELAIRYKGKESDDSMDARAFLQLLREANGSTFKGYKGGDYQMGKTTPVWVANYGESGGFATQYQGIVDVSETDDAVVLETAEVSFH